MTAATNSKQPKSTTDMPLAGQGGRHGKWCLPALAMWLLLLAVVAGGASCRPVALPEPVRHRLAPAENTGAANSSEPGTVASGPEASPEPMSGASVPVTMTPLLPGLTATFLPSLPAPQPTITHIVQEGDTLSAIAMQYEVDYLLLLQVNDIVDPDHIYAGQALVIPMRPPEVAWAELESQVIGYSTGGHPIDVYRFGEGPARVALIGGIHGGYEWNTILLAYEVMDYYAAYPSELPDSITLYIIPSANPDGQFLVTGQEGRFLPEGVPVDIADGRFNANGVDLNRNWPCNWEPVGYWGEDEVDAGRRPFSEVEVRVLRDFFLDEAIDVVVFWHSSGGAVYPGYCNRAFPEAQSLGRTYAAAAGYAYEDIFTAYPVTGDAADWLSLMGVPGLVVELITQTETEFARNLAGTRALLDYLSQE